MRRAAGWALRACLLVSLCLTVWSLAHIATVPGLQPVLTRTADEITAVTDRMMARSATPERLTALINARLAETPRNWVALQALADLAGEQGIALPPAYAPAWDEDSGILTQAATCATCAYDPSTCTLSNVLICQAPIALTPIGDIAGITRAGIAYSSGAAVDQVDLALSVVGLGATAAVVATGGSSTLLKAGASTARMARRMNLLSPRLVAMTTDTIRTGVDWAALPAVRSADDLAAVVRADAFTPLAAIVTDMERLRAASGTTTALHLMPMIDTATDAGRLARAGEALGPRLLARAEVLGKSRLLRATIRVSDTVLGLFAGIIGLAASLASLISGALYTRLLHRAGRAL